MDCSVHPNAMVSFDFSSLSNVHKSVQRNSRTSKRKIRMDINKNALQSFFESERDFAVNDPQNSRSGPMFQGFSTQRSVSSKPPIQDLPTTPDYQVISAPRAQGTNNKFLKSIRVSKNNSIGLDGLSFIHF